MIHELLVGNADSIRYKVLNKNIQIKFSKTTLCCDFCRDENDQFNKNPGGYIIKDEQTSNYAEEINYTLDVLWRMGGKEELNPVSEQKFINFFQPKKMKTSFHPRHFKYLPKYFWKALIYLLNHKVNIVDLI